MSAAVLEVAGSAGRYGDKTALDGIDLRSVRRDGRAARTQRRR